MSPQVDMSQRATMTHCRSFDKQKIVSKNWSTLTVLPPLMQAKFNRLKTLLLNCCNGTHTNIQTHCCTLLLGSAFLWHRFIKHYSNKPQNWSSFCAYYWAKKLQLFTSLSHLTGFLFPFIQKSIHTNIKQFKILVPQKSACLQKPTFGLLKTLCLLLDTPWSTLELVY